MIPGHVKCSSVLVEMVLCSFDKFSPNYSIIIISLNDVRDNYFIINSGGKACTEKNVMLNLLDFFMASGCSKSLYIFSLLLCYIFCI